jgi:hypothetical protein
MSLESFCGVEQAKRHDCEVELAEWCAHLGFWDVFLCYTDLLLRTHEVYGGEQ